MVKVTYCQTCQCPKHHLRTYKTQNASQAEKDRTIHHQQCKKDF